MRSYKKLIVHLSFLILHFLASCAQTETSHTEFVLGTVCSITVLEKANNAILSEAFAKIREIDNLMSLNIDASDISRINAAAGTAAVRVHEDVFNVIKRALLFAQLSGGAFDPSVGPLTSLWGVGSDRARVPSRAEIEETLPLVNWRDIETDGGNLSVFLKREGMALDLGAIAKGYAADKAAAVLAEAGVKRAIIDLGGNILIIGEKEDKSPWRVGIQNPYGERGEYLGVLQIWPQRNTVSIVTSSVNERFFEEKGQRYHHIFSPFTGCPEENELLSVTIIAASSMDADALSTAVFVLGYEKGKELVDSISGAQAVFIFKDRHIRATSGADFTITDSRYNAG